MSIVTDGFVGNVVLKVCEGVFEFVMKMVGKEVMGTLKTEKPLAQQALRKHRQALRLPRARRRPASGHRRHLHHLPRQLERTGHRKRPQRRRQRAAKLNELIVAESAEPWRDNLTTPMNPRETTNNGTRFKTSYAPLSVW